MLNVQNPYDILWYWLVYKDPFNGSFKTLYTANKHGVGHFWGRSWNDRIYSPEFPNARNLNEKKKRLLEPGKNISKRKNWWVAWNITFTPRIEVSSRDKTGGLMVRVQNIPSVGVVGVIQGKSKTTNLPHTIQVWYAYICLNFEGECRQIEYMDGMGTAA